MNLIASMLHVTPVWLLTQTCDTQDMIWSAALKSCDNAVIEGQQAQHLRPPMAWTLSQRSDRDCSNPPAQSLRQLGHLGLSRIANKGAQTPNATTLCSTASDLTLQFLYSTEVGMYHMAANCTI